MKNLRPGAYERPTDQQESNNYARTDGSLPDLGWPNASARPQTSKAVTSVPHSSSDRCGHSVGQCPTSSVAQCLHVSWPARSERGGLDTPRQGGRARRAGVHRGRWWGGDPSHQHHYHYYQTLPTGQYGRRDRAPHRLKVRNRWPGRWALGGSR